MKQVKSISELKKLAESETGEMEEFFISLAGGIARSSKRIVFDPRLGHFDVHNEIDDTYQENLTEKQLKNETNIIEAINAGALYKY